jgi:transcriptional regulator with XRE-family HTH domain
MSSRFPLARLFSRAPRSLSPQEVRAAREAHGWTVDQMADLVHALPLEVQAWEAGTITMTREQAANLRLVVEAAAHDRLAAEAGIAECGWISANLERLEEQLSSKDRRFDRAERELRMHVRACPECRRREEWLRHHPPPGDPVLLPRGVARWWARVAAAGGLPVRIAARALALVLGVGALTALVAVGGEDGFRPSVDVFLALCIGLGALWTVAGPTQRLADEHPVVGANVRAAAILLPLLLTAGLRGMVDLATPAVWLAAGGISLLFGMLLGTMAALRFRGSD